MAVHGVIYMCVSSPSFILESLLLFYVCVCVFTLGGCGLPVLANT